MKKLFVSAFVSMFTLTACYGADNSPTPAPVAKPAPVAAPVAAPAKAPNRAEVAPGAKTKEICTDIIGKDGKVIIDPATKKPKQTCKTIKIHKKAETVTSGADPTSKKK